MDRPGQLARRLSMTDAVLIGVGAMLGAGVFAAPGPAAAAAGPWLLASLVLAAVVAYANAASSAQLAAQHPEAGGTYVYARVRIGPYWGFLAGWAFVIGKTASLAAMALTFGAYISEDAARPLGIAAVAAMTVVNYLGIEKTARLTRWIVAVIVAALACVVAAGVGSIAVNGVAPLTGGVAGGVPAGGAPAGVYGVLQAAGLLFFAFAGYARLATLGEEVESPRTTIPRAIPIALGIVVALYALVLGTAVAAVGPGTLAASAAPLVEVVRASRWPELAPAVQLGAVVAAAGVLLSLLAGVSRTVLAMARRRELPAVLDAVHPVHRTPYRAEIVAGVLVSGIVLFADLRGAIGFSSFAVLTYYALANVSAWRMKASERRWPRWLAVVGFVGCVALAATLPLGAVVGGTALLVVGSVVWVATTRQRR